MRSDKRIDEYNRVMSEDSALRPEAKNRAIAEIIAESSARGAARSRLIAANKRRKPEMFQAPIFSDDDDDDQNGKYVPVLLGHDVQHSKKQKSGRKRKDSDHKQKDPLTKRQKRNGRHVAWTDAEFNALRDGLAIHGNSTGKWAKILRDPEFAGCFIDRNNVDLKDKARNEAKARIRDGCALGSFQYATVSGGDGANHYTRD